MILVMKRLILFFVSIVFLHAGSASAQVTVWEKYGIRGRVVYQHFHEIDFEKIVQDKIPVPEGLTDDIIHSEARYGRGTANLSAQKKQFAEKIVLFLKNEGIDTDAQLSTLSAAEVLKKTSDIVTSNIYYQFVRTKEGLSEMENRVWTSPDGTVEISEIEPAPMDCFLIGCGVCVDYAETYTNVFNWFKKKNIPSIRNVFVVTISDDDHTDLEQDYDKKLFYLSMGIKMDKTNTHAWNAVIMLDPEYLTYSFFDVAGPYHQYGRFDEAELGKQLSQFEGRNLFRLYAAVGEYEKAYDYFKSSYPKVLSLRSKSSNIETLKLLARTAERLRRYDEAFKYYSRIARTVNDIQIDLKIAEMSYKIENYALSLNRFQNLFLKSKDEDEQVQIQYLHGIHKNLVKAGNLVDFEKYQVIAQERKLPYMQSKKLLQDMVQHAKNREDRKKYEQWLSAAGLF